MRLIAISDIHGYFDKFIELLEKIQYVSGKDRLYILGDMIDRGPASYDTLNYIKNLQEKDSTIQVLVGNHETNLLVLLAEHLSGFSLKEILKDKNFIKEYSEFTGDDVEMLRSLNKLSSTKIEQIFTWLTKCPYYFYEEGHFFVHAGFDTSISPWMQEKSVMTWGLRQNRFFNIKGYPDVQIIFGHTPTSYLHYQNTGKGYQHRVWFDPIFEDKIGIDCSIWKNGKLAALIYDTNEKHYKTIYV